LFIFLFYGELMKKYLLVLVSLSALLLAACGGSSAPEQTLVAASDATVSVNSTVTAAVKDVPFVFSSGVSALGTTGPTTLSFTSSSATPSFTIASGGNTASGVTRFGSCIFVVSNSSFPAGHPLANGQTVTVNPCSIQISTAGGVANGQTVPRSVALLLGAAASAGQSVQVAVSPNGNLTLNGNNIGVIRLTPVTGG
jgi:hypothetical protein